MIAVSRSTISFAVLGALVLAGCAKKSGTSATTDSTTTAAATPPAAPSATPSADTSAAASGGTTVAAGGESATDWKAYEQSVKAAPRDTITATAYQGWKQYELNCSRCHGEFGVGSSFAPALVASLKDGGTIPDRQSFIIVVCNGRVEKGMPSWCAAGLEMDKIVGMYEYLKGRADGKIHAGRPASK